MMASGRSMIIHLGLPKTSTTWLHNSLYPFLPSINYAGYVSWRSYKDPVKRRVMRLDKVFWRQPAEWRNYGGRPFRALVEGSLDSHKNLLFSEEKVVMPRIFAEWAGPERENPEALGEHLAELKALSVESGFEGLSVLVVIRRQDYWLASRYAQSSGKINGACQRHFEAELRRVIYRDYDRYGRYLDYRELYNVLVSALGSRNVLMMPFEARLEHPTAFLKSIMRFVGETAIGAEQILEKGSEVYNARRRTLDSWTLRPYSHSIKVPRVIRPYIGGYRRIPVSKNRNAQFITLTENMRKEILSVYESSNRRLSELLGSDLARYGYANDQDDRE